MTEMKTDPQTKATESNEASSSSALISTSEASSKTAAADPGIPTTILEVPDEDEELSLTTAQESEKSESKWKMKLKVIAKQYFQVVLPVTLLLTAFVLLMALLFQITTPDPDVYLYDHIEFTEKYLNANLRPKNYLLNRSSEVRLLPGSTLAKGAPTLKEFLATNSSDSPYFFMDFHEHTVYSDGRLTPRQLLQWAQWMGYDAIVVTDHNTFKGARAVMQASKADENFPLVLPGIEYSCCRLHMNIIGILIDFKTNQLVYPDPSSLSLSSNDIELAIQTFVELLTEPFPNDKQLQRLILATHNLTGVAMLNHVFWSTSSSPFALESLEPALVDHPDRQKFVDWGVDLIEVVNGGRVDGQSYALTVHQGSLGKPPAMVSGSDIHKLEESFAWTIVPAKNKSIEAIMDSLRKQQTAIVLRTEGSGQRRTAESLYADPYSIEPKLTPYTSSFIPWMSIISYLGIYYDHTPGMVSFITGRCRVDRDRIHGDVIGWSIFYLIVFGLVFQLLILILLCCLEGLKRQVKKWKRK